MNLKEKKQQAENILRDLELNHNHSWIKEIYNRNQDNLDDIAIYYRGNEITYDEFLNQKRVRYAKALDAFGIKKGTEVPMCVGNCPEFLYLLSGISTLGATFNSFGNGFDKEYIREIIDGCDSDILFVSDDMYESIRDVLPNTHIKKTVLISLADSLKQGNPYEDIDKNFKPLVNKVKKYLETDKDVLTINQFLFGGLFSKLDSNYFADVNLDDVFSITYSSGSTNSSRPKAIVHDNKSYIVVGRFHDDDVSDLESMKKRRLLAHIPTHSNTNITSAMSDALMQNCTVAMEPTYDVNFFPYSLMINFPSVVTATRSFWISLAKYINNNVENNFECINYKNLKAPDAKFAFKELVGPFSVGEPLAPGEEKYTNKAFRKVKMGSNHLPFILPSTVMSIAGGDCEHGGLFCMMFKALQDKKPLQAMSGDKTGLAYFKYAEVAVLDENGNHLEKGKMGRLVGNSPCDMLYYKNDEEATHNFYCYDSNGKRWSDFNVHGYIDQFDNVHLKGRINYQDEIPPFMIADVIQKDTKNILSCEVIPAEVSGMQFFVANIEFNPEMKKDKTLIRYDLTSPKIKDKVLESAERRCQKLLPNVHKKIVYRIIDNTNSFPLTGCGKRNNLRLKELNLDNTFKVVPGLGILDGKKYINVISEIKHMTQEKNDNKAKTKKKSL